MRLILVVVTPIYDQHSANEREVKSPQECLQFYCNMAKGLWTSVLANTVTILQDLSALEFIGFCTHWETLGKKKQPRLVTPVS